MSSYDPKTCKIERFDSPGDYFTFLQNPAVRRGHKCGGDGRDHFYGVSYNEALRKLDVGDVSYAEKAEKLIREMDNLQLFSIGRSVIMSDVVGFMPNVPAVLAGVPETMFARQTIDAENTQAPLCVYVETTVSSNLSQRELINRGTAVLAFVMAMNIVRPVELYVMSLGKLDVQRYGATHGAIVKMDTRPLDLARAAWMLASPEYARRLAFPAMGYLGAPNRKPYYHDSVPLPFDGYFGDEYEASVRQCVSAEPHDVVIRGGYGGDALMLTEPAKWVKQMIEKHIGKEIE